MSDYLCIVVANDNHLCDWKTHLNTVEKMENISALRRKLLLLEEST